jgi:hypothetical protein
VSATRQSSPSPQITPKKMGEIGEIVPERHSITIGSKQRDMDDEQLHRVAIGSRIEVLDD